MEIKLANSIEYCKPPILHYKLHQTHTHTDRIKNNWYAYTHIYFT